MVPWLGFVYSQLPLVIAAYYNNGDVVRLQHTCILRTMLKLLRSILTRPYTVKVGTISSESQTAVNDQSNLS